MLQLQEKKYIYNEVKYGIEYDYNLINKTFSKMLKVCKAPKGLFMPNKTRIDKYKWNVFLSERSTSKTTQWLLYGMIMNALYGTTVVYVRTNKDMTTRTFNEKLFNVICMKEYGYIPYLTNEKYNSVHIDKISKEVFYCHRDETGLMDEIAPEPFCIILAVSESDRYYGLSLPFGDLIIFDEFSRGTYKNDDWVAFNNMIATVRRDRESMRIVMLSNTVNPYHQYLVELGISKALKGLKKGAEMVVTAQLGAVVYVQWVDVEMHKTVIFKKASLSYHGFANEKLKAIYGGDWEYKNFPRLPKDIINEVIDRTIYIEFMGRLLALEVMTGDLPCINIRPYTRNEDSLKDNAIIITDDEMNCYKSNHIKGNHQNMKFLLVNIAYGRVFYANNDCGTMINDFIKNLRYI